MAQASKATNLNMDYSTHAKRAVALFDLSVQAKAGGFARAIFALVLAMRQEIVAAHDVAHYLKSTDRKKKTEYMNNLLDEVFGFNHSGDAPRKAETKTRGMIGQCLLPAYYLHTFVKHPPAMLRRDDGTEIVDPTAPRIDIHIVSAGKSDERAYLMVPGSLMFKPDDKKGDAHREDPCIKLTGSGGLTVENLMARARAAILGDTDTDKGADAANTAYRSKPVKDVSIKQLMGEVANQVRSMKSEADMKPLLDVAQELRAELTARLPIGDGMDEDEGTIAIAIDDTIAVVEHAATVQNKGLLARLARLYDAMEEAFKDDDFAARAEAAKRE